VRIINPKGKVAKANFPKNLKKRSWTVLMAEKEKLPKEF
jgi:hypothetical protein